MKTCVYVCPCYIMRTKKCMYVFKCTESGHFLESKDILAGPHFFKGCVRVKTWFQCSA